MTYEKLRRLVKLIFDRPFLYHTLRPIFLGGLPMKPMLALLDSNESDVIIDVGCGTGFLAEKIRYKQYLGFDQDLNFIKIAQKRKIKNAEFILEDISKFNFDHRNPTKAILAGVLHHLNDDEAIHLLNALSQTVTQWLVTFDPVYSKYHIVSNLLCKLDRGKFVRTEDQMLQLINRSKLSIETKKLHYSNTKIGKYIIFRLLPKR